MGPKRGKTREIQVTIGFNLASDWLKNQQVNSDWLEHVAQVFSRAWEMQNKSKHNMNVLHRNYMYALLTKRVRSRWLNIGQVLFCFFMGRDEVAGQ